MEPNNLIRHKDEILYLKYPLPQFEGRDVWVVRNAEGEEKLRDFGIGDTIYLVGGIELL